jgi:hypothetical protein
MLWRLIGGTRYMFSLIGLTVVYILNWNNKIYSKRGKNGTEFELKIDIFFENRIKVFFSQNNWFNCRCHKQIVSTSLDI